MLEKNKRFPEWLYSRDCFYRVNWNGEPDDPEPAGEGSIKSVILDEALSHIMVHGINNSTSLFSTE